jgi:hypothetical protein
VCCCTKKSKTTTTNHTREETKTGITISTEDISPHPPQEEEEEEEEEEGGGEEAEKTKPDLFATKLRLSSTENANKILASECKVRRCSGNSGSDEGQTNKSDGNDGDVGNRTRAKKGEFSFFMRGGGREGGGYVIKARN